MRNKYGCKDVVLGLKKFTVNLEEWKFIQQLFSHFSEIMKWNKNAESTVGEYYRLYVKECVRRGTIAIDPNSVIPCGNLKIINCRRLHVEIPILMKEKLAEDFYQGIVFGVSE